MYDTECRGEHCSSGGTFLPFRSNPMRNRNISLHGRPMAAPTYSTENYSSNSSCRIPCAERELATESGVTQWPYLTTGLPVTNSLPGLPSKRNARHRTMKRYRAGKGSNETECTVHVLLAGAARLILPREGLQKWVHASWRGGSSPSDRRS